MHDTPLLTDPAGIQLWVGLCLAFLTVLGGIGAMYAGLRKKNGSGDSLGTFYMAPYSIFFQSVRELIDEQREQTKLLRDIRANTNRRSRR